MLSPTATIKEELENMDKSNSGDGNPWTNMAAGAVTIQSRSKSYTFDDVVNVRKLSLHDL